MKPGHATWISPDSSTTPVSCKCRFRSGWLKLFGPVGTQLTSCGVSHLLKSGGEVTCWAFPTRRDVEQEGSERGSPDRRCGHPRSALPVSGRRGARWARFERPVSLRITAPSTSRSRNVVASVGRRGSRPMRRSQFAPPGPPNDGRCGRRAGGRRRCRPRFIARSPFGGESEEARGGIRSEPSQLIATNPRNRTRFHVARR